MKRRCGTLAGTLVAMILLDVAATGPSAAQLLGPEFQVNSYTTGDQLEATVAANGQGGFVAVWETIDQFWVGQGLFGQRFDSEGMPAGSEFEVGQSSLSGLSEPAVAMGPLDFVVAWQGWDDDSYFDVIGRSFDPGSDTGEFRVNSFVAGNQNDPALAAGCGFVVVWSSSSQGEHGVFGQRLDSSGLPLGSEFQVSGFTWYGQYAPAVSADATGGFVVAWESRDDIYGQRFDPAGVPSGPRFRANSYTTSIQDLPAVAVSGSGEFVVVWGSYQDGWGKGIFGQRFDSTGLPIGGEFQVNTYTPGQQVVPAVAADNEGNFLVTWTSQFSFVSDSNVLGQRFDSSGDRVGSEFQINTTVTGHQSLPAVAATGGGRFVVVWGSDDGSGLGVFGQRVEFPLFYDGFEAGDACAWSAAVGGGCP